MSDEQKLAGGFTSLLRDIFDSSGSPDSQAVPGGLHYPPFRRGKAGGQDRAPAPWGEKCFFTVTHQCAAFGGRGSSFGEWELLCYFLFTGFLLAVFSHLGDNGFKSQSTVILWLEHFSSSPPPPFLLNTGSLVSTGETGKWRRGKGEEKTYFGQGGAMHRILLFYILESSLSRGFIGTKG